MKNLSQELLENEDGMKFWEFGGMRITLPSKVTLIWITHAWLQEPHLQQCKEKSKML